MPRRYIHSTTVVGSSIETDTAELQDLVARAADQGIPTQTMEDELAARTGFEDPVRNWFRMTEAPNGLVRKIILNNARSFVGSKQK